MNSKTCQKCSSSFPIYKEDLEFYERVKVPPPTFCPMCRAERRLAFRGERRLYKRKSDLSGKEMFSMYAPEAPVKVYEKSEWFSDAWDPMSFCKEIDFTRPFFIQVKELWESVPMKNVNLLNEVNSDFNNHASGPKNCYLVFNSAHPEDCMYSNGITHSKDCIDVSYVGKSELCYECFWLNECARCVYSSHCEGSFDLMFCKNCIGCNNCFGCVGLKKAQYQMFNEQCSKEEYERKVKEFNLTSRKALEEIKKKVKEVWLNFPTRFMIGTHNTDVSGNYIERSKNVKDSFLVREGENLRYCQYAQELPGSKDCYDYSIWGDASELVYESCACGINVSNILGSLFVQDGCNNISYSVVCSSSSNLFGCVGLRSKRYCILNKQYSKEEYEMLVPKVIEHMKQMPYIDKLGRVYGYGEFFPIEFSPFAYNDSVAAEYFPITKEEAQKQNYFWKDSTSKDYQITKESNGLPDNIKDTGDSILKEIIACRHKGECSHSCPTAFRILPQELEFYRKMNLPIPDVCNSCRHSERISQRTHFKLVDRLCDCAGSKSKEGRHQNTSEHIHGTEPCKNTFQTAYKPSRKEIVYCESCYQCEIS